ncbi:amidase family protein [Nocardia rhizosphaerihabitans]|uniref:amidase family protein n=1 Tax=Nocardia rhizosphaerihabitans TaxID=1691570 RepID=UPI00366A91C2
MTAIATAQAVTAGETTATAVVEDAIAAAHQPDSASSMIAVTDERARFQAAASDRRARRGIRRSVLDGVPIVWKDLFDVQGTVTTRGSASHQHDEPAAVDSELVRRAHDSGLVTVGKTNLSEFAFSGLGINTCFGTPANPVDPELIPGGSSSGSAVAVARGLVALAVGTDTSGSVRVPAALCGIVGFRASPGRYGPHDFAPLSPTLDSVGLFATTVADIAALDGVLIPATHRAMHPLGRVADDTQCVADKTQRVVDDTQRVADDTRHVADGARHAADNTPHAADNTQRAAAGALADLRRWPPPRFVVPTGEWTEDLAAPVADAFATTIAQMRTAGADIEVRPVPSLDAAQRLMDEHGTIVGAEAYRLHSYRLTSTMPIEAATRRRLRANAHTAGTIGPVYAAMPDLRAEFAAELGNAMLLCPTVRCLPPRIADPQTDPDRYDSANSAVLRTTMVLSYLGSCGISVPTPSGAPGRAVLLSLPAGGDDALLAAAAWSEWALRPGLDR